MAAEVVKGIDLALSVGGVMVGCARSSSISMSTEMLNAACKEVGAWSASLPGQKSWEISTDGVLVVDVPEDAAQYRGFDFVKAWLAGTKLAVKFGTDKTGHQVFNGDVYISNVEMTGEYEGEATYSVSLTGTGPLTLTTNAATV
jgi:TP901-1 family phage major tail protein